MRRFYAFFLTAALLLNVIPAFATNNQLPKGQLLPNAYNDRDMDLIRDKMFSLFPANKVFSGSIPLKQGSVEQKDLYIMNDTDFYLTFTYVGALSSNQSELGVIVKEGDLSYVNGNISYVAEFKDNKTPIYEQAQRGETYRIGPFKKDTAIAFYLHNDRGYFYSLKNYNEDNMYHTVHYSGILDDNRKVNAILFEDNVPYDDTFKQKYWDFNDHIILYEIEDVDQVEGSDISGGTEPKPTDIPEQDSNVEPSEQEDSDVMSETCAATCSSENSCECKEHKLCSDECKIMDNSSESTLEGSGGRRFSGSSETNQDETDMGKSHRCICLNSDTSSSSGSEPSDSAGKTYDEEDTQTQTTGGTPEPDEIGDDPTEEVLSQRDDQEDKMAIETANTMLGMLMQIMGKGDIWQFALALSVMAPLIVMLSKGKLTSGLMGFSNMDSRRNDLKHGWRSNHPKGSMHSNTPNGTNYAHHDKMPGRSKNWMDRMRKRW